MSNKASASKFYGVHKGYNPGVYTSWQECSAQVSAFSGAVYKGFQTLQQAEEFVRTGLQTSDPKKTPPLRLKRRSSELDDEWEEVYCDGACKGNGKSDPVAGIGIWWGVNDERNCYYRCPGAQTNNRAELIAIIMVLLQAPMDGKPLIIKTDSQYSIQCVTEWCSKWARNGWKTAKGEPVKNKMVLQYLMVLYRARERWGHKVKFEHVRGHVGVFGNERADKLAGLGCTLAMEEEWDWVQKSKEFEKLFEAMLADKNKMDGSTNMQPNFKKVKVISSAMPASSGSGSTSSQAAAYSLSESEMLAYVSCLADDVGDDLL